jgi:large conductance mechanosensitive channel
LRFGFSRVAPTLSQAGVLCHVHPGRGRAAGAAKDGEASMSIGSEFKEFIARGNVIDLAVGVIIGGAFGKIVSSLVDQVIMPPIGLVTGGIDFAQMKIVLKAADPAAKQAEVAIQYGAFLNTVIQFVIIGIVIFLLVKAINSLRREEAAAPAATPPAPTKTEALLEDIRDAIRTRS